MRALGSVGISKRGLIRVHEPKTVLGEAPNLFFDGEEKPVVEISHNRNLLQMTVDSGGEYTVLNASFRNAMTIEEARKLQNKSEVLSGASGTARRQIQGIPNPRIEVLDKPVHLTKVSLLPEGPRKSHDDGIIGMDALWSGFHIDFEAMRLGMD